MADARLPPYVMWRQGRPRFQPSAREQRLGFAGRDFRHDQARWFSYEEACAAGWPLFAEILDCRGYDDEQAAALLAAARIGNILRLTPARRPHRRHQAPEDRRGPRAATVATLIEDWLFAIEQESDPDERLAASSIESYRKAARALLYAPETRAERAARRARERAADLLGMAPPPRALEAFACAPPASIDKIALNDMYKYLKRVRGHHMARAAVAAFSAAWSWGELAPAWRLGANPRRALEFAQPEGRIVIYSDGEIRALVAAADYLGRGSVGDGIMLGLLTCQRQGDRLAMRDDGLLDGRRVIRQSKSGKLVPVKETPQLTARLDGARARTAALLLRFGNRADPPGVIVVNEETGLAYNGDDYRHAFAEVRAVALAGVPGLLPPCPALYDAGTQSLKTDQDLRDTGVTWLARAGCTLVEICAISGHSARSVETIIRHYLGSARELADSGIDKLVAWMNREGIAV